MVNPYTPASSNLFYGREQIIRSLLRDEQAGQSVVIIGGRRCGKTRLLERIRNYLLKIAIDIDANSTTNWISIIPDAQNVEPNLIIRPHWPVLINLMGIPFNSFSHLLSYLSKTIADSPFGFDLPTIPNEDDCDPEWFEQWLIQIDKNLHENDLGGLALLFDEVEELFAKNWHHDFMSLLRRLDDSRLRTRIWIVLAGANGLDQYQNPGDGSPALNTTRRTFLADLDYAARRRMTIEPFVKAGLLPLTDAIQDKMDKIAAGNVWILTLLLEYLFDKLPVNEIKIEEGINDFLTGQARNLSRWANPIQTTNSGWSCYNALASQGILPAKYFRGEKLRKIRSILEYQGLAHRQRNGDLEMGPELFRRWAYEENYISEPFNDRPPGNSEDDTFPPGQHLYEVAISYASTEKQYASDLAFELIKQGKRVFYDQYLTADLWGANLGLHLPDTYNRQSKLVVLLISQNYVERQWPMIEARESISKALREGWNVLLPVYLDNIRIPEIPESVVCIDLSGGKKTILNVALDLIAKLKS